MNRKKKQRRASFTYLVPLLNCIFFLTSFAQAQEQQTSHHAPAAKQQRHASEFGVHRNDNHRHHDFKIANRSEVFKDSELNTPTKTLIRRSIETANSELKVPKRPQLKRYANIAYRKIDGVAPRLLSLDLYVPLKTTGPSDGRPVLVMIHGGAWQFGDKANKNVVESKVNHFVGRGYVFVSVNYRLTQNKSENRVQHPLHAEDCAAAVAWVHNNIEKYGGDPNQLHLMGHSAGAHLAGIVATDHRFLARHAKSLSILKSNVLLDTAAIDIPGFLNRSGAKPVMRRMYATVFGTDQSVLKDASPMHHISPEKQMPPTLLFYGERLELKHFAEKFCQAMTEAGAPSRAIFCPGRSHAEINRHIGMIGDPMTDFIMKLHSGKDPTNFPIKIAKP